MEVNLLMKLLLKNNSPSIIGIGYNNIKNEKVSIIINNYL